MKAPGRKIKKSACVRLRALRKGLKPLKDPKKLEYEIDIVFSDLSLPPRESKASARKSGCTVLFKHEGYEWGCEKGRAFVNTASNKAKEASGIVCVPLCGAAQITLVIEGLGQKKGRKKGWVLVKHKAAKHDCVPRNGAIAIGGCHATDGATDEAMPKRTCMYVIDAIDEAIHGAMPDRTCIYAKHDREGRSEAMPIRASRHSLDKKAKQFKQVRSDPGTENSEQTWSVSG
eukprot:474784-Pelagomonas_calceolata.AAC.5